MATKRKRTTKNKKQRNASRVQDASGGNDAASARKYRRGGRVEAYTFGEVLHSKRWP